MGLARGRSDLVKTFLQFLAPQVVMVGLPQEFSRLVEGRVGLAAGRSRSIKKLVAFLVRTPLALWRARPHLRGARALGMDGGRPRAVVGELPGEFPRFVEADVESAGGRSGPVKFVLCF